MTQDDITRLAGHRLVSPWVMKLVFDAVKEERQRIVNLLMIQHEAVQERHNYWLVAANLIQADVASDT